MKSGLPLHLKVKFFPSGISLRSTSMDARAKTSLAGPMLLTNPAANCLPPYTLTMPAPIVNIYEKIFLWPSVSREDLLGSEVESRTYPASGYQYGQNGLAWAGEDFW